MIIDLMNKHHVFIYKSKSENTSALAHLVSAIAVTINKVIFLTKYLKNAKRKWAN